MTTRAKKREKKGQGPLSMERTFWRCCTRIKFATIDFTFETRTFRKKNHTNKTESETTFCFFFSFFHFWVSFSFLDSHSSLLRDKPILLFLMEKGIRRHENWKKKFKKKQNFFSDFASVLLHSFHVFLFFQVVFSFLSPSLFEEEKKIEI